MSRFRSAVHNKVHGVKVSRQVKQASNDIDRSYEDGFETSSNSDSESASYERTTSPLDCDGLGVDFVLDSVVDLLSGRSYFCVCIGEAGEPLSRKKRRGVNVSRVLHSRSPLLAPDESTFMLKLDGLRDPEITVRFSRSAIVGQDSFIGECHILVGTKGPIDSVDEHVLARLVGGGNSYLSCHWRIVPFTSERRPNILPDESLVSDTDKLLALVTSVRKCMDSLSENDPELEAKKLWIFSLLEVLDPVELNFLLVRISITDLMRLMPSVMYQLETVLSQDAISVQARTRLIKAVQTGEYSPQAESLIAALFLGCRDEDLFALKHLLNRGGDRHHMPSLIFSFIQSELVREHIILRMQQVARIFSNHEIIHVLSEIDQVVYTPYGSVRLWPDGSIPGAHALFKALSRDITFVSNKPLSFESWTHKIVRKAGFEDCPILTGSKSDLYALKGGVAKLQSKVDFSKYANWSHYRRLFPESKFVWFGESIDFARTLMQDEAGTGSSQRFGVGRIALALVMGEEGSNKIGPYTAEPGLVVCGNFIQAAIACVNEGLLMDSIVLKDLVTEFGAVIKKMEADSVKQGKRNKHLVRERLAELKVDLNRLTLLIKDHELKVENIKQEMVDSIILTPIEAQSPTLTDRSAGTDQDETIPKDDAGRDLVLEGI